MFFSKERKRQTKKQTNKQTNKNLLQIDPTVTCFVAKCHGLTNVSAKANVFLHH